MSHQETSNFTLKHFVLYKYLLVLSQGVPVLEPQFQNVFFSDVTSFAKFTMHLKHFHRKTPHIDWRDVLEIGSTWTTNEAFKCRKQNWLPLAAQLAVKTPDKDLLRISPGWHALNDTTKATRASESLEFWTKVHREDDSGNSDLLSPSFAQDWPRGQHVGSGFKMAVSENTFSVWDYVVFSLVLGLSAAIGKIYFLILFFSFFHFRTGASWFVREWARICVQRHPVLVLQETGQQFPNDEKGKGQLSGKVPFVLIWIVYLHRGLWMFVFLSFALIQTHLLGKRKKSHPSHSQTLQLSSFSGMDLGHGTQTPKLASSLKKHHTKVTPSGGFLLNTVLLWKYVLDISEALANNPSLHFLTFTLVNRCVLRV